MFQKVNTFFNDVSLSQRLGTYAAAVVRPTQDGVFPKWLQEQAEMRGRHIVIREVGRLMAPFRRGFSKAALSRKEHGEMLTVPQLYALSRVLRVSAEDMLARIAKDYGADVRPVELPAARGRDAEALADWFEAQDPERQRSILLTLGVDKEDRARRLGAAGAER